MGQDGHGGAEEWRGGVGVTWRRADLTLNTLVTSYLWETMGRNKLADVRGIKDPLVEIPPCLLPRPAPRTHPRVPPWSPSDPPAASLGEDVWLPHPSVPVLLLSFPPPTLIHTTSTLPPPSTPYPIQPWPTLPPPYPG